MVGAQLPNNTLIATMYELLTKLDLIVDCGSSNVCMSQARTQLQKQLQKKCDYNSSDFVGWRLVMSNYSAPRGFLVSQHDVWREIIFGWIIVNSGESVRRLA